jgi:hypothetical protein
VNDDTTGTGPGPGEVLDARLIARLAAPSDSPVAAERERIRALFDKWITIALAEPNAHSPEAWKVAFADLISDRPQFAIAGADPNHEPGLSECGCRRCDPQRHDGSAWSWAKELADAGLRSIARNNAGDLNDGRPAIWSAACAPGGYVCAVPDPSRSDGICGMPVESEPCGREHGPATPGRDAYEAWQSIRHPDGQIPWGDLSDMMYAAWGAADRAAAAPLLKVIAAALAVLEEGDEPDDDARQRAIATLRADRSPAVEGLQAPRPVVRVLPEQDTPAADRLLCDNQAVMAALMRALSDPGQVTPRAPLESLQSWRRRAVIEHAAPLIAAAERDRYRREHDEADARLRQMDEQARQAIAAEAAAVQQAEGELAKARDMIRVLGGLCNMYVRGLYAAWIDAQRGDLKAVIENLAEGLDGFEGPEWNGTETGTEWHDRTAGDGDA